jgi:hypothetical protein
MYKLNKNSEGIINGVFINNTFIPFDEANTDYQAYLAWVAQGNTPLPADKVTQ